jgi:putative acetyltransferase
MIRKATESDLMRIAEIAVFVKRMNYRRIFCDDDFSFNKLTVGDTVKTQRLFLGDLWVYESDHIVKAYIHVCDGEIKELYTDHFFQGEGIGAELIRYAINQHSATHLWVLKKNVRAISFYERNGFKLSGECRQWNDTGQYIVKMVILTPLNTKT